MTRQAGSCVHCGKLGETRDHAPSKVFMDIPYPRTMPTLPSCGTCNQGFSNDEEYLACFIECVIEGTSDPDRLKRTKVKKALRRNGKLKQIIERSRSEQLVFWGENNITWAPDMKRVRRVVLKLAHCHVAHELNEPQRHYPDHVFVHPLITLNEEQRKNFETLPDGVYWPDVNSRGMERSISAIQRVIEGDDEYVNAWCHVQEGRYRYMAFSDGSMIVRGVISEYLGYEVIW